MLTHFHASQFHVMSAMKHTIIKFRDVKEDDWTDIGWLASNVVQQADHSTIDTLWTEQRISFSGTRHHAIAEYDGQIAGYCSLERSVEDSACSFRVFLVADWNPNNRIIHEALFDHIEKMISARKTEDVWMRELVGDANLIEFMQSKGFEISEPYAIDNLEMVNLFKKYSYDS